jgi:nucleoside phosphorylase
MLIIFGALKIELNNIIQSSRIKEKIRVNGVCIYSGILEDRDAIIVQTGMGRENALKAVDILFTQKEVRKTGSINVLITGFCGASRTGLEVGDLVAYKRVMDLTRIGNIKEKVQRQKPSTYVKLDRGHTGLEKKGIKPVICGCTDHIVSTPEEKRIIFSKYGVEVIDMESYWLIRELLRNGISRNRIFCIRSVSDDSKQKLPHYFSTNNILRTIGGSIKSFFLSIFSREERNANIHALNSIKKAKSKLDMGILKTLVI